MLVNLGIGLPTLVADFVPKTIHVFFQSENGLIGTGPIPWPGLVSQDSSMPEAGPSRLCPAPPRSTVRCPSRSSAADTWM